MKTLFKIASLIAVIYALPITTMAEPALSSTAAKQLVKDAVVYALENNDPNMDYSKYVAKDFVNYVDENTFNYEQWVAHQKNIKKMVKSMKPDFTTLIAEGDKVAAVYMIHLVKNDGSKLEVKDMGIFTIKNNKIVEVDELTHLMKGDQADKNIGSTK